MMKYILPSVFLLIFYSVSAVGSNYLLQSSFLEKGKLLQICAQDPKPRTNKICYEGAENDFDPLITAAYINDVEYLTRMKLDLGKKQTVKESAIISHALSIAAAADSLNFLVYLLEEVLDIKRLSVDRWQKLNRLPGFELEHPIFEAAQNGNIGILAYFIKAGVPTSLETKDGLTLVSLALLSEQPRTLVFLQGYGVQESCKKKIANGKTIKSLAVQFGLEQYISCK